VAENLKNQVNVIASSRQARRSLSKQSYFKTTRLLRWNTLAMTAINKSLSGHWNSIKKNASLKTIKIFGDYSYFKDSTGFAIAALID
jgi:hypothetical protein